MRLNYIQKLKNESYYNFLFLILEINELFLTADRAIYLARI